MYFLLHWYITSSFMFFASVPCYQNLDLHSHGETLLFFRLTERYRPYLPRGL